MKLILNLFICCALFTTALPSHSGSITTPEIVNYTTRAALSCMRWKPVGMCFWLKCSISGCSVRTSIKVGHYQPDAVVSVYNELGENPWREVRSFLRSIQQSAAEGLLGDLVPVNSAGNRTEGGQGKRDHRNLIFRETDVVGHPISALSYFVSGTGYWCRSQTIPFFPYFQSGLDALSWRMEIPEMFYPASVIPGMREMGRWPWQTWGGVYPRTGWTTQTDEPKAAAINAQRAGDITTRVRQPHIYVPIRGGSRGGQRVWPPRALVEGNARTGVWQMLLPKPESSCRVFGQNDLRGFSSWGGGKVDPEGDYAWNLWRPYSCCRRRGAFLFDINWIRFP
jgi:integrating conjugative element protein (TIGR03756 family)